MADAHADTPEFHVVVRRPGRSPLAPYRFPVSTAFALAIAGNELLDAAQTGNNVDHALMLAGGSGLFAWIVLGRVNAILRSSAPDRPTAPAASDGSGDASSTAERTAA